MGRSPRLGQPEDIAAMVAMLFSDDGEWINGQIVSVDGGIILRG
jgi:NAD(P)-dependent dehydrogenase (short-subunit alcohol dehydrogenase family)